MSTPAPIRLALAALIALAGACTAPPPRQPVPFDGPWTGFDGHLGARRYRDATWGELDEHAVVGITGSEELPGMLLGIDGGLFFSSEDGRVGAIERNVTTTEGYAGVMRTLRLVPGYLDLELGAGAALTYVYEREENTGNVSLEDSDSEVWASGYGRVKLLLHLGQGMRAGVSARVVRGGDGILLGVRRDGDYEQIAFVLGVSF